LRIRHPAFNQLYIFRLDDWRGLQVMIGLQQKPKHPARDIFRRLDIEPLAARSLRQDGECRPLLIHADHREQIARIGVDIEIIYHTNP
jgi:hypothetical protein